MIRKYKKHKRETIFEYLQSCSPSNWCGPPVPANLKASVINFLRNSSSVKSPRGAAIRSQRLTIASMPAAFATTSVTSVHQDVVWLCASNLGVQPQKFGEITFKEKEPKHPSKSFVQWFDLAVSTKNLCGNLAYSCILSSLQNQNCFELQKL